MKNIRIATAQFEPMDGDKSYNLSVMEDLIIKAKNEGAEVISFHELCVTAYTFLMDLDRNELLKLAEKIPGGTSCNHLIRLARKHGIVILAGVLEKDEEDLLYNSFVCVDKNGLLACHRKLHPFISKHLTPGNNYTVFDLKGWRCGILICYDNNVIENVRATTLLGADIIFAPHVTGLTPSSMPGRGYVDDEFWQERFEDPESLRKEFDGPKGLGWLMRWMPARAYDNGVYFVFSNPVGYDGSQLKNGNSMIFDPYGEIIAEVKSFEDEITLATVTAEKLKKAGGYRYRNARRPEIYRDIIGKEHQSKTKPIWLDPKKRLQND